jgi:hypothetical protein
MEVQNPPEWWSVKDWRNHMTDPASDELRAEMGRVATEDEKEHRFFLFVTATYWLEALAANCCARFDLDANRTAGLLQIQQARQRELEPVRRQWRIAAAIIAAAGFIASQVPKETFTALGFDSDAYGLYRLVLIGVVVTLLGVVFYGLWLGVSSTHGRELGRNAPPTRRWESS